MMKRIAVLFADGFEEIEAVTVVDVLRRADCHVDVIGVTGVVVRGSHGMTLTMDDVVDNVQPPSLDALVLPGGIPGATNLAADQRVLALLRQVNSLERIVAAICAAPIVLISAGIAVGHRLTSYPSFAGHFSTDCYVDEAVVVDRNIITSRGPGTAFDFSLAILQEIGLSTVAAKLRTDMLLR